MVILKWITNSSYYNESYNIFIKIHTSLIIMQIKVKNHAINIPLLKISIPKLSIRKERV